MKLLKTGNLGCINMRNGDSCAIQDVFARIDGSVTISFFSEVEQRTSHLAFDRCALEAMRIAIQRDSETKVEIGSIHKCFVLENLTLEYEGIVYTEEWKDIKGYEGLYQISSFGRCKTRRKFKKNYNSLQKLEEKIMSPGANQDGYLGISLWKDKKAISMKLHRVVGLHFLEDDKSLDVNHKDANRANNFFKNLEFGTKKYNMQYAMYVSRTKGKITPEIAKEARKLYASGISHKKIAELLKVNKDILSTIFKGRSWTHQEDPLIVEACKRRYCTGISKRKKVIAIRGEEKREFESLSDASRTLNINVSDISSVTLGQRKQAGGYYFKTI